MLIISILIFTCSCKSLLDIEIETTNELIALYENKTQILSQIYELKSENHKLEENSINPMHLENVLKMQEGMYRKYNANFTDLLGFEDPLAERKPNLKSKENSELDYAKKRSRLESLFYERILFNENQRDITHFELMNVKPLTKASYGGFMTHGVLIGM